MKRAPRKHSSDSGYVGFRKSAGRIVGRLEVVSSEFFGESSSPLNLTGAIIVGLVAISAISGVIMLFFYTPDPEAATESVRHLTHDSGAGTLIRAIHRTCAELMVLALIIHMIRNWATGRYAGKRAGNWVTGLVALPVVGIIGWAGYILPWDQRAMVLLSWGRDVAYGMDKWVILGWLHLGSIVSWPVFSVANEADQLLRIFALHIGGTLAIIFFLLWHLRRVTPPRLSLPIPVWTGLTLVVLLIAAILPLEREQLVPFNPYSIPEHVHVDFFVNFPLLFYPLAGGPLLAALVVLVWLLIAWLPRLEREKGATAVVVESLCTGCRLCLNDCPYGAIEMLPHPEQVEREKGREIASVIQANCASCGICVGSCGFHAIELPVLTSDEVDDFIDSVLVVREDTRKDGLPEKPFSPFEGIL